MTEGWLKRHSPLTCTHKPENLTHGFKKNSSKNSKNSFFISKNQSASRKELISVLNSVMEDILIYHLRLKENFFNFFFGKKSFKKSDTWVQKKIIKKQQKQFFYLKKSIRK